MAQVPYQPYSEVSAQDIPTPNVHVQTSEDAFGAGTAKAVKQLGAQLQHSGDELFQRAMALKELENETIARKQDLEVSFEADKMRAEFKQLPGSQQIQNLDKFNQSLKDLYEKHRNMLPNDSAKKKFDAFALSQIARNAFNAAGEAGTAYRRHVAATAAAQKEMIMGQLGRDPSFENWKANLPKIREAIETWGAANDLSPAQIQLETEKALSQGLAERAASLNRQGQPEEAGKILDENRHLMKEPDLRSVENGINNSRRRVGADRAAREIVDDYPEKSLEQVDAEAEARAARELPNDPMAKHDYINATRGRKGQKEKDKMYNDHRNQDALREEINKNPSVSWNTLISSSEKLYKSAEALEKSNPGMVQGLKRYLYQQQNLQKNAPLPGRRERFIYLLGLSQRPEEFMKEDLLKPDLRDEDRKVLLKIQNRIFANPDKRDTRVEHAMPLMREILPTGTKALTPRQMTMFKGALQALIAGYMEESEGKKPTDADYKNFGKILLQEFTVPGAYWGTNEQKLYQVQTPSKVEKDMVKSEAAGQLPVSTPEHRRGAYIRQRALERYQDLYSTAKKRDRPEGL